MHFRPVNLVADEVTSRKFQVAPRSPESAPSGGWPLISIITPTLNRAHFLKDAISSVQRQWYPRVEHIVVDGGSTDDTLLLLHRYPSITVLPGPDGGSHQAMNKGLNAARGEIIGFLNSDDEYAPGIMFEVARLFAERSCLAIVTNCRFFRGVPQQRTWDGGIVHRESEDDLFTEILYGVPGFNGMFFRKQAVDALGGFDATYDIAADREFLIRLMMAQGCRVLTCPVTGYHYRRHDESRTLDSAGTLGEAILQEHRRIADALLVRSIPWSFRRAIRAWHTFETIHLILMQMHRRNWRLIATICKQAFRMDFVWPARFAVALMRLRRYRRGA